MWWATKPYTDSSPNWRGFPVPGKKMSPSPPRLLTRDFVFLVMAHFLGALAWTTLLLLPVSLEEMGADRATIGWIISMAPMVGICAQPVIGWALDHFGRKRCLVVGTLFSSCSLFILGQVEQLGPTLWLHRALFGVGGAIAFTGFFAFIADKIPEERRVEGIALFGISGLLPLALNPVIGQFGLSAADLQRVYPIAGGLVLSGLFFLLPVADAKEVTEAREPIGLRTRWQTISSRNLRPVWAAVITFSGMTAIFMTFATVAAKAQGLENPAIAWFTYAAGSVLVRLFGAKLPERLGPNRVLLPALLAYSGSLAVTGFAQSELAFLLAGLLAGFGHGYAFPVITAAVVSRSPLVLRGTAMASCMGLWQLTGLGIRPLFGWVGDLSDLATLFLLAAGSGLVGIAVWATMERRLPATIEDRESVS